MNRQRNSFIAEQLTQVAQGLYLDLNRLPERLLSGCKRFVTKYREALITWGVLLLVAVLCFGFGFVSNGFTLPLSGDGYLQEQTFPYLWYDYWHEFFQTGQFPHWDTSSALGSNNMGGNTFYSLLSPFQMLLLPFPRSWIPTFQGLRYMFSTALGGFFFYLYLRSFNLSCNVRRVGAVAYGFCGWVMYFLWFEHFLDSFAFLPLILWGIEKVIQKRDPRLLIFSLAIQGITNYFFLVQFCVGGAFYALWRYVVCWGKMGKGSVRLGVLVLGLASFAIGLLMCGFVLIPGVANSLALPRVESSSYLKNLLSALKGEDGKGIKDVLDLIFKFDRPLMNAYPADGFFFMTLRCYSSNILGVDWYDNASGSSFIFTPMMLLVFAGFFEGFRRRKFSYILGPLVVGFMMCTPFFYYLFSGFTLAYARFLLVPTAWMIAFACIQLEHIREIKRGELAGSFAFVVICQAVMGIISYLIFEKNPDIYSDIALAGWRFALVPASIAVTLVDYLIMRHFMKGGHITTATLVLVGIEAAAMCNITLMHHGYGNLDSMVQVNGKNYGERVVKNEQEIIAALKKYDDSFYRIQNTDASRSNPNLPMIEGYNGLSAFNSVYAVNAQDFLNWSRVPYTYTNWSMGAHNRRADMETFLGVKYYIVARADKNVPFGYENVYYLNPADEKDPQKAQALSDLRDVLYRNFQNDDTWQISRDLYVNNDFVDLAFPFDGVISSADLSTGYQTVYNEMTYLRYGIVDKEELSELKEDAAGTGIDFLDDSDWGTASQVFRSSDTLEIVMTPTSENGVFDSVITFMNQERSYKAEFIRTQEGNNYIYSCPEYYLTLTIPVNGTVGNFVGLSTGKDGASFRLVSDEGDKLTFRGAGIYALRSYISAASDKVTVYSAHWDDKTGQYVTGGDMIGHQIYPADTKFDYDNPGDNSLYGLLWWTKVVIEPRTGDVFAPLASEDNPYYIAIDSSENFDWIFVDENDEELPIEGLQSYSDYQTTHGFYVDRPISKIIGVLHDTKTSSEKLDRPDVFIEPYGDYRMAVDKLNEEPVTILYRDNDYIEFQTDYSDYKYVVTNQPLEPGWALKKRTGTDSAGKAVYEDVKTYKGQGGFLSFLAEPGESEYVMYYVAPGWDLGVKATLVGLVLGGLFFAAFTWIAQDRNIRESRLASLKYGDDLSWHSNV